VPLDISVSPDEADLGGVVDCIFGGLFVLTRGISWAYFYIPETKNRTVEMSLWRMVLTGLVFSFLYLFIGSTRRHGVRAPREFASYNVEGEDHVQEEMRP